MELELRDYLRILRKRKWWVILSLVACLGAAAVFTVRATPVYEAESKLFVGQQQVTTQQLPQGVQVTQLSLQLLETYAEVLRTRPIAEHAVEEAALPIRPTDLVEDLEATPILDTQLIRLRYRSPDPALAQRVVNATADAFVSEIENIEAVPGTTGEEPAVKVSVVESALRPESPVSPQPVRNMVLAFVLGAMLGVGVAFLVEYLDTSVKDTEDVERVTGYPVLAAVPRFDTKGEEVHLERDPQAASSEAFRKLRTAIQFLGVDDPVRTVLVTSPFARDGKSTTAVNLAAAFAQGGYRTLLLEADLRRPSFHHVFGVRPDQGGLTGVLIGRTSVEAAVAETNIRNLACLHAGALPPNPVELLASEHAGEVVRGLRERYEMVIVDSTPLLPVADASALAPRCDGVLMVARAGQTHRERLGEAVELLGKVGGRPLGIVLNVLSPRDARYGYEYYYGYRSAAAGDREAPGPARAERRPSG